jgi:hypothetical protein
MCKRPIEVSDVVQVKLEVVVMEIPSAVLDFDEGDLLFDQPPSQEHVLAEFGLAVGLLISLGFP